MKSALGQLNAVDRFSSISATVPEKQTYSQSDLNRGESVSRNDPGTCSRRYSKEHEPASYRCYLCLNIMFILGENFRTF